MRRVLIFGLVVMLTFLSVSIVGGKSESMTLTYKDFDELNKVCTYEDNWCTWANYPGKAVVYGYMEKRVELPEGTTGIKVTIQICSRGWGEGLAVDVDRWAPDSAIQVMVNDEVWENKILKGRVHHHSYYKHEYGESFSTKVFNISGKQNVTLTIKMVGGKGEDILKWPRIDFWNAVLTFYIPEQTPTPTIPTETLSPEAIPTPGFEAIPTIMGLLMIAYVLRRQNK